MKNYKNKVFAIPWEGCYTAYRNNPLEGGETVEGETRAEALLCRNLRDAGCEEEEIRQFLRLGRQGRHREQLGLLSAHRAALLERLHTSQRQIDCLDYLIYQMKGGQMRGRN